MAFRRRLKGHEPPDKEGWEAIESVIEGFEQQMKDAVAEDHAGKRKAETTWRVHRIHFEKNRFIFDLMYKQKALSRELYDYMVRQKIADGALIAKWRKPGFNNLCSMLAIQKGDSNFGTTAFCRVPLHARGPNGALSPSVRTGCISCADNDAVNGGPIWWNTPLPEDFLEQKRAAKSAKGKGKRPAEEAGIEDPEVAKRLAALRGDAQ